MGTSPHDALARATEEVQRWLNENGLVGVCDFCARPTRDRVTFVTDGPFVEGIMVIDGAGSSISEIVFDPYWLACEACADVVDTGDPEALADHVFAHRDKVRVGTVPADYRKHLARLYRTFFEHRPQRQ